MPSGQTTAANTSARMLVETAMLPVSIDTIESVACQAPG